MADMMADMATVPRSVSAGRIAVAANSRPETEHGQSPAPIALVLIGRRPRRGTSESRPLFLIDTEIARRFRPGDDFARSSPHVADNTYSASHNSQRSRPRDIRQRGCGPECLAPVQRVQGMETSRFVWRNGWADRMMIRK
jgi:hypothetical protein